MSIPVLVRSNHPATYRGGQWAAIDGILWAGDKPCFDIVFIDGKHDQIPIYDPVAQYEFSHDFIRIWSAEEREWTR